ncbi:MAG: twin-arginine translocase subunit TatC [Campylobacteraceae bacterium]
MFEELKPHLAELRKRLTICALVIFVFFGIAFLFWKPVMYFMAEPLFSVMSQSGNATIEMANKTQVILENFDVAKNSEQYKQFFMTNEPMEAFFMALKISFFTALVFAIPVIFWQLWLFIAPGLYDNEKKHVIPFTIFTTVMFLLGGAFCYLVVMPLAFNFVINFGKDVFVYIPKVTEYISFFIKLVLAFGFSFELPVIALFLGKLGLITDKTLKDSFRYAIVLIFIVAAIITPPDVTSQILMAIPLILLYGLSIFILKKVNPYVPDEEEETEEENAKA